MGFNINLLGIKKFISSIFTILNKTSFFFFGFYLTFFILFNSGVFSSTSSQALSLTNVVTFLSIFTIGSLFLAFVNNPSGLRRELKNSAGFKALLSFMISFVLYGILFVSFEGRLDSSFVTGFLLDPNFLFSYMFVVAFFEESTFRVALVQLMKSKSSNVAAVYFVSALIFALYHYFKYSGDFGYLLFAFISGLGFTALNLKQEIGGFPTFPSAVALHMVFNLYSVGALSIALNLVGM